MIHCACTIFRIPVVCSKGKGEGAVVETQHSKIPARINLANLRKVTATIALTTTCFVKSLPLYLSLINCYETFDMSKCKFKLYYIFLPKEN